MNYILGKNVSIGDKILVKGLWYVIDNKNENFVTLSNGDIVEYGDSISGWKS